MPNNITGGNNGSEIVTGRTRNSKKAIKFNARPLGFEINTVTGSADNPDSWASAVQDQVEAYEDASARELYDSLLGNRYEDENGKLRPH